MVHISKSKKTGQFIVSVIGKNGEKLSSSELLRTRQSVWKNIFAQSKVFAPNIDNDFLVVDKTGKKDITYSVERNGEYNGYTKTKIPF